MTDDTKANPVMQRLRHLDRVLAKADGIVNQEFEDADDQAYFRTKLVKYLRAKLAMLEPTP